MEYSASVMDSNLSSKLYALNSLSLTQKFTRDMFLWHTMTIWRRCQGISRSHSMLFVSPFIMFWDHQINTLLCELTRSGEWGDHVTLQAAADSV